MNLVPTFCDSQQLVRLQYPDGLCIELPLEKLEYANAHGLIEIDGHSMAFWVELLKRGIARIVQVLPKPQRKLVLRTFRRHMRAATKALRRVCSSLAKIGASERHGASPSFLCEFLYPTPREELA